MTGLLTVKEVAARLGVKPKTINKYLALGHFPNAHKLNPHLINSPYRIPEKDVVAFEQARHSK